MTTTEKITLDLPDTDDPTALMHEDPSSLSDATERIYLTLDPQSRAVGVTTRMKSQRDMTPFSVYHGREYRITLPANADASRLREWAEEHADLLRRIFDGHSVEWDGSNNVGQLTDDARIALDRLKALVTEGWAHPSYVVDDLAASNPVDWSETSIPRHDIVLWDASEWLAPTADDVADEFGITGETGVDRLREIAKEFKGETRAEGIKLTSTLDALQRIRDKRK